MNTLTAKDKDLCTYAGVFGFMLSLTCLIQHLTYTRPHWISVVFIIPYVFSITCFLILTAQQWPATTLLIINAVILFVAKVIILRAGIFSLAVLLLSLYTILIVVVTHINRIPHKLRQKAIEIRTERELWKDKI